MNELISLDCVSGTVISLHKCESLIDSPKLDVVNKIFGLNNNYQGMLSLQVLVQQPWFNRHCAFLGMKDVPSSASTLKNATPQLKNCWY
jgi:hypothetical protein